MKTIPNPGAQSSPATIKKTYYNAKPNRMFPPETTVLIRFVRTDKPVPCAACGKTLRKFWTMLCPFHAMDFGVAALKEFPGGPLAPLTLVCDAHPIAEIQEVRAAFIYPASGYWAELGRLQLEVERKSATGKEAA